jgi:integrase/recombinase XerC
MLKKHITDFIAYCKVTDFSINSIKSLHTSLQDFAAFVDERQISAIKAIGYGELSGFVADFKAPSIHKKKARVWSLHQFFHFLTLNNIIKKNIALDLPYPKIEKTVPHFLTISEFNRIIEHFMADAESTNGLRNLIIILMLGLLGLRTGTVTALDVEHVDTESGLAWITEKGRRQRQLVLPKILNTLLEKYINEHQPAAGPLFLSKRKKRISSRILKEIFETGVDELGINKHLHGHLFRHTAATHLNKVAGTAVTQAVLGHERRYNTLKYAHLNPDLYATYMKRHPFMQGVQL